jgi:DNA (cytosine-5)-methyltransferase 1
MAGMAVVAPWRQGWEISEERREAYRRCSLASARAKEQAAAGEAVAVHPVYRPRLDPATLMPAAPSCGLSSLSLFSGGGGLDIGFERAGFVHVAASRSTRGSPRRSR